ncbi:MAG: prepilin peptidase [Acetivibrionales bacterium]
MTAPDLIPVPGYLLLRGKCRHCGAGTSLGIHAG